MNKQLGNMNTVPDDEEFIHRFLVSKLCLFKVGLRRLEDCFDYFCSELVNFAERFPNSQKKDLVMGLSLNFGEMPGRISLEPLLLLIDDIDGWVLVGWSSLNYGHFPCWLQ